jgi:hypothetical protein
MKANEAIERAKQVIMDLFGYEQVVDLVLEEIGLSPSKKQWLVVLSFMRPLNPKTAAAIGVALASVRARHRKLVRLLDSDGTLVSVTDQHGSISFEAA